MRTFASNHPLITLFVALGIISEIIKTISYVTGPRTTNPLLFGIGGGS